MLRVIKAQAWLAHSTNSSCGLPRGGHNAVQCAQGIQDHFRTHNAEEAEARAEMAEALRLNPHVSLEWFKQFLPFKDPAMLERHIAALRKAGLK